jgi:hypothetical protein
MSRYLDVNVQPLHFETIVVENPLSSWLEDTPTTITVMVTETCYVPVSSSTSASTTRVPTLLTTAQHHSTYEVQLESTATTMAQSFVWPQPQPSIVGTGRVGTVIDGRGDVETTVRGGVEVKEQGDSKVDITQTEEDELVTSQVVKALRHLASGMRESPSHQLSLQEPTRQQRQSQSTSSAPSTLSTFFSATATSTPTISDSQISTQKTYLGPRAAHDYYQHAPPSLNAAQLRYNHPYLIGRSLATNMGEFELGPLPAGLQIALYVCLALGSVWIIIVWLINFPPHTWHGDSATTERTVKSEEGKKVKEGKDIANATTRQWWRRILPSSRARQNKHKPLDKPSKYFAIQSASFTSPSTSSADLSTATTSATPTTTLLRKRNLSQSPAHPPANQQHQDCEFEDLQPTSWPRSPTLPPWQRNITPLHRQSRPLHSQADGTSTAPQSPGIYTASPYSPSPSPTPQPPSSPGNPYIPSLPAPPRTSTDYLTAHTIFFKPSPFPKRKPKLSLALRRRRRPRSTNGTTQSPAFEERGAPEAQRCQSWRLRGRK